jgi:uncharacterized protein (TIGR02147 family)
MQTDDPQPTADFHIWLQNEFGERSRKNPKLSLRAFAKRLDIDPSTVSQLLSGKRRATPRVIAKICDQLSVPPKTRSYLMEGSKFRSTTASPTFSQLTVDAFAVIADWYHYAILELTFTEGFQSSPTWIARKLKISPLEVKLAIERLKRLELLEETEGQLRKTDAFLTNGPDGATAPALKELQRQVLQKALEAIDCVPQGDKDITSMTMAIDPSLLPEARKRIRNFRRELCVFLEQGQRKRVYHLGLQLYPVSEET